MIKTGEGSTKAEQGQGAVSSEGEANPAEAGRTVSDETRIAFFQQWFSDEIPHNRALDTRLLEVGKGRAVMRLDWAPHLVGNPDSGVLHGGAITALLDSCCGVAVGSALKERVAFATLDLRIDYARPATPRQPVIAEAECYRLTSNIAFTRAIAHQGDPKDIVAAAAGTFMISTKGPANGARSTGAQSAAGKRGGKGKGRS